MVLTPDIWISRINEMIKREISSRIEYGLIPKAQYIVSLEEYEAVW